MIDFSHVNPFFVVLLPVGGLFTLIGYLWGSYKSGLSKVKDETISTLLADVKALQAEIDILRTNSAQTSKDNNQLPPLG